MKSVLFTVIIVGVSLSVGALLYNRIFDVRKNQKTIPSVQPTETPTPTYDEVSEMSLSDTHDNSSKSASYNTNSSTVSVSGSKMFSSFSMAIASGWRSAKTETPDGVELVVSNGQYQIFVSQSPTKQETCTPPFVEITGVSATYVRVINEANTQPGKNIYTICQKNSQLPEMPTDFGNIVYETPLNPTDMYLLEMDVMLASIKKIINY